MRNSDHQVEQLAERYRELIVAAAAHNDAAAHVTTQMELTKDQLAELAPDHPLLEPDAVSSVLGDLQVHPLGALLKSFSGRKIRMAAAPDSIWCCWAHRSRCGELMQVKLSGF